MQLKRVSISKLKNADYNPEARTEENRKLTRLVNSIKRVGILYPVLINSRNLIIDGHRRVAAAKLLGMKTIQCIVTKVENNNDAYAEVNANSCKLSGHETLQVWLKEPSAVTTAAAKNFAAAEELIGRPMLERMAKNGCSLLTFRRAREAARHVDKDTPEFIRKATAWMLKYRAPAIVNSYIQMRQNPAALLKAIESNKDLKVAYRA